MNPFNNVQLSEGQVKGLISARKQMVPLLKKAQERLLDLPLREIIDPAQGISDLRRFATSEELQRIVMDVFKGLISVDTKLIREKSTPAVVARVLLMTDEGLVPLVSSTASQPMTEMFGGRAVLVAESRAIRRALRELGLRAEFEIYDEDDRVMKSDAHVSTKQEVKATPIKDELKVVDDFEDDDVVDPVDVNDDQAMSGVSKVPKDLSKTAKENGSVRKAQAKPTEVPPKSDGKKNEAKKESPPSKTQYESDQLPEQTIDIEVDYSHADWPDRKKTNYPSVLSKGVDSARAELSLTMNEFVQAVLGTKRFANKKAITFRSLKTTDLELLYQFYVINKGEK